MERSKTILSHQGKDGTTSSQPLFTSKNYPWSPTQPTGSLETQSTLRKGHGWTVHPALQKGRVWPLEPTYNLSPNYGELGYVILELTKDPD